MLRDEIAELLDEQSCEEGILADIVADSILSLPSGVEAVIHGKDLLNNGEAIKVRDVSIGEAVEILKAAVSDGWENKTGESVTLRVRDSQKGAILGKEAI